MSIKKLRYCTTFFRIWQKCWNPRYPESSTTATCQIHPPPSENNVLLRDHWQKAFVTLTGFCPLSTPPPSTPPHPPPPSRNTHAYTHTPECSHQFFCFFLFYISLASADILFHNFLELLSTSEKNFSLWIFLFECIHSNPHPYNSQNPLSVTKVFCRCPPQLF